MNIIEEIEIARQRVIQQVNTEFNALLERAAKSGNDIRTESRPYELRYPRAAGSGMFKGKKPMAVMIGNESFEVKTWKELVKAVMEKCTESKDNIIRLYELAGHISGKKRVLLATSDEGMRSPIEIAKHMYMETHYDTETLLNILITRILMPIGYDVGHVWVVIRNE